MHCLLNTNNKQKSGDGWVWFSTLTKCKKEMKGNLRYMISIKFCVDLSKYFNKHDFLHTFCSWTYSWSGLWGCLEHFCTYSSFPRKDVSLHTNTLVCFPEDTLFKGKLRDSPKSSQPLEATGVETWSELMDVRSVLRSNDVQDESDETEGLVSSFSSCHLSLRSIVREWQATRMWGVVKKKKKREMGEKIWMRWKVTYAERQLLCLFAFSSIMSWRVRQEEVQPKDPSLEISNKKRWP